MISATLSEPVAEAAGIVDAHHHLWDLRVRDQDWIAGAALAPSASPYVSA